MDKKQKIITFFLSGALGLILGLGFLAYQVEAQIIDGKLTLKTLEPKYDVLKTPKITLEQLAQQNSDAFEYTYGRLDYMVKQLNDLQDTCAK